MNSIILLHGAIGAKDQLEPLAKELKQVGFDAHTFNFSGHGTSSFQNEFSIKQFASELETVIQQQNLIKPIIAVF